MKVMNIKVIVEPHNYCFIPYLEQNLAFLNRIFMYYYIYFNVNYWNKKEFYVKFDIFSILKWNFQNINAVIVGLYN